MSSGSDWVNFFVHQSKEFIDSVSGPKRRNVMSSETSPEKFNAKGVSFTNSSDGSINIEENDYVSSVKDGERSSGELASLASSFSVEKMPLSDSEKEIYEKQLEQLQEQLVDLMIKNQEMDAELTCLRESDVSKLTKELDREKIKRKQLEVKLKRIKSDDTAPKLRRRKRQDGSISEQNEQSISSDHQTTDNGSIVSCSQYDIPQGNQSRVSRFKLRTYRLYVSLSQWIALTFWNIVADLSDDETVAEAVDEDGPPLAVKTLKDNIHRFSTGIKPMREFFKKISWVLSWKNPAATMLIFLVYVFTFWRGYTVPLLLFLVIVQLSANFVYSRFGTISDKEVTETANEQASWSDRFQVVLHVARKVQNVLGDLSDNLEKMRNLLTWRVPHVTLRLYIILWLFLVASIFLTGPHFFTLLGMLLGCKLFITGPLYKRFPKLKKRHDTTHHLWTELPTDCQAVLEDKQTDVDESPGCRPSVSSMISESAALSSRLFCERYNIISDEVFVKGWEEGWRTSLMNKQKPLVNIKHGRLYLTQNYLCFERSRTNTANNILMKLSDIKCVNKYKPLFLLPGSGMSIEVCIKDKEEPYIFGAMAGRDEAYNDIVQMAKNSGLSWAT